MDFPKYGGGGGEVGMGFQLKCDLNVLFLGMTLSLSQNRSKFLFSILIYHFYRINSRWDRNYMDLCYWFKGSYSKSDMLDIIMYQKVSLLV